MTENAPFPTPVFTTELTDQAHTENTTNRSNDCDTNVRVNENGENDVVCANESKAATTELTEVDNIETETAENAQATNNQSSQETVEEDVAENETQAPINSMTVENVNEMNDNNDNDSTNDIIDDDARTEIEEIEFGRERTLTEETGDGSGESLTFDENHFSTPTGGVTPERRASASRRRRATTSSMEDSEVSSERAGVTCNV